MSNCYFGYWLDEEIPKHGRRRFFGRKRHWRQDAGIEVLESRITPTTDIWTGAVSSLWSNPGNWSNGTPTTNQDLVFPATGVTQFSSVNDLTAGINYNSITVAGSGYQIQGNQISLTQGITASYTTGSSLISLNMTVGGGTVSVSPGGELDLGGALAGASGLDLSGGGTLGMTGAVGNSYLGATTVDSGSTLLLEKTSNAIAIPAGLVVNSGVVTDLKGSQFAPGVSVSISGVSTLNLDNNSESIGSISMAGGTIATGSGTLSVAGNVTTSSASMIATISGHLALTGTGQVVMIADSATLPVDLRITAAISGTGGIVKQGPGSLELVGANTYAGPTMITAGMIQVDSTSSLGSSSSAVTIASGAELDLNGPLTLANPVSVSGTGTAGAGAIVSSDGNDSLSGNLTLAGPTTINVPDYQLTLNGVISDGGSGYVLTQMGHGAIILAPPSANTNTGGIVVDSGTLELNSARGPALAGPLVIGDGVDAALVQSMASLQLNSAALTVNTNGALNLNNFNDSVSGITLTGGSVETGTGSLADSGGITTIASATTAVIGGNLQFTGAAVPLSIAQGTTSSGVELDISAVLSGSASMTKSGAGELELDGSNTSLMGALEISSGAVLITNGMALGAGAVTVASGAALDFSSDSSLVVSNPLTIAGTGTAGAGVLVNLNGTTSVTANITLAGSSTLSSASGGTSALDFYGTFSDGAQGYGVTMTGGGAFELANDTSNSYTGSTTLDNGSLYLAASAGAIAIPGNLIIGDGINTAVVYDDSGGQFNPTSDLTFNAAAATTSSASLQLLNVNETVASLVFNNGGELDTGAGILNDTGGITYNSTSAGSVQGLITGNLGLNAATSTFNVAPGHDPSGVDLEISAVISNGGIIKAGAGTLGLAGANTFATTRPIVEGSGTTVSNVQFEARAGTVQLQDSGTLGANSGGVIQIDPGAELTTTSTGSDLYIPQSIFVSGTGVNNQGALYVLAGTTVLDHSANLWLLANTQIGASSTGLLEVDAGVADYDDTANITITNGSAGTTVFSNNNALFNSAITVTQGYFDAWNADALGAAGNTVSDTIASGGTFVINEGITLDPSKTLILQGTGTLKNGAPDSKVIDNGDNTIAGRIVLQASQNIAVAAGDSLILSGGISDSGLDYGLTQIGAGDLVLSSSSNTFSGSLVVQAGALSVDQAASPSTTTVESGGELAGNGTLGGMFQVQSGGTLQPGTAFSTTTGILTVGAGRLDSGSSLSIRLNGTTAGIQYDQLDVTPGQTLTISGATLDLSFLSGYTPAVGSVYTIISLGSGSAISGTFNGLTNNATFLVGRTQFQIVYTPAAVTLTALETVDTWVGEGGNNNWSTAANWQADIVPQVGDALVFPATANLVSNNNLTAGMLFHSMQIDAAGYTFTGNSITLTNGISDQASSGNVKIGFTIDLGRNQNIFIEGGTLSISGAVTGAGSLKMTGGTLSLSGGNTYSGGTYVSMGMLSVSSNSAVGSGSVTITQFGELDLHNNITLANPISVVGQGASNGSGAAINAASGSNTLAGTITLTGNTTINSGTNTSVLTMSGLIQGDYGLTFIGSGSTTFTGSVSNTFAGPVDVNSGTLSLQMANNNLLAIGPNATINVGDGTDQARLGLISTSGQLSPTNTVNVANHAQYYQAAGTAVSVGALTLRGSGNGYLDGAGSSLTVASLDMTGSSIQMLSGATVTDLGALTTHPSSTTAKITGGTFNLTSSIVTMTVAAGMTGGADLDLSSVVAGPGAITLSGGGMLELDGANTFAGGTTVRAGRLAVTNNSSLGTGSATIASGAELDFDANVVIPNQLTVDGDGTTGAGALASVNGANAAIAGSILLTGPTAVEALHGGSLTFQGVIGDGGSNFSLTVNTTGGGLVEFAAANTYGGVTTVASGILELLTSNAVSPSSQGILVDLGASLYTSGFINLGAVPLTLNGAGYLGGALVDQSGDSMFTGPITLDGNSSIDTVGNLLTLSGPISDGGSGYGITVSGPGVLDLSGTSSYTGATEVIGALRVDGNLTSSSVDVLAGGVLEGSGYVHSITSTSGVISPGELKTLSTGVFSLDSASVLSLQIAGASPGNGATGYESITAAGPVSLGGATLIANLIGSYTPRPGDQIVIFNNTSGQPVTGAFAGLPEGSILDVDTYQFCITYQGGANGQDIVLEAVAATTTQITTASHISTYGQSITLSAQVTGGSSTPSGTVEFFNGNPATGGTLLGASTTNAQGVGIYSTQSLPATNGTPDQIYAEFLPSPTSPYLSSTSTAFSQTINPAMLSVSASNETATYGEAFPSLAYRVSGLVNGDQAANVLSGSLTTTATSSSNVGAYPISQGTLAANSNYTISFSTGTLTIKPAPLVISVNPATKVVGAPMPLFTANYSGFVRGDTAASLTSPVQFSTAATAQSSVGTYTVTPLGATDPNYAISFEPGRLTILQGNTLVHFVNLPPSSSPFGAPLTFTLQVSAVSPAAGVPSGTVIFEIDRGVYDVATIDSSTGMATIPNVVMGVGLHQITTIYTGDSNFVASQNTSLQDIVPANTITTLSVQDLRKKGKLVGVILTAQVVAAPPSLSVPYGAVTFGVKSRRLTTQALDLNGLTVLRLKPAQARKKTFTAAFSGDDVFDPSTSSPILISATGSGRILVRRAFTAFTSPPLKRAHAARETAAVNFRWPSYLTRHHGIRR